ncbi:Kinesin, motor domain-containing protein [Cynara cardunculus var. scolymus]|uniref:Kinesin, motor domain-containing protein n=1 Tax=Cynara cardunculus var. scolymus TaxID=59895 RepID=A0A103XYF8_CYNCS|nr:Kinesin, motor domain-containing protein [Cynara cardunculus var. scolymus]
MKSNAEISRHRSSGSISISAIRNLLPRSGSAKKKMANPKLSRFNCENVPPVDPNIEVGELRSILKESTGKISVSGKETTEMAELEPQQHEEEPLSADPHVKVVARIRPPNSHERGDYTVRKVSDDSVSVGDRKFTLDAVIDSKSSQEDVFQLVGVPMVKSAMAGYNTSILAYGQTGSGKTYTLWGPPSAMVEDQSANGNQGIVPRIFQMLFTEIQRERDQAEGKQINYQCRCSFLEIYNDQIGDLLDPTQRNLEIKDDAKHGFYVENLTEEYVTGYEDVTQILIKGLSNKKVGATSINSKSSRSHIVLTCVIESWCKFLNRWNQTVNYQGSSKTSRITLVDLAGLEKNRTNDAGKECAREGEFVKKSISQLGNLVNILAGTNQSGLSKDIPYNNSCLTHLLRESLGGNSKLIVICAISPDDKCSGETISTLRFGHRAKLIHNNPVVNKITEDDVNDLSDQIRELKEELIRAKSDASYSIGSNTNYKGGSVRQSLNQLRVSLNRSLILPQIDNNDVKEELHIDEHDVRDLRLQLDMLHSSCDEEFQETSESTRFFSMGGCDDLASEQYASCQEESENEEIISEEPEMDLGNPKVINISAGRPSDVFNGPTLSESPKIGNAIRKSMALPSNIVDSLKFSSTVPQESQKISDQIRSSLRSSKMFGGPTESLAASLQRGLDIIDNHQRSSVLNKSLVALSFEHLATKTNDASVQTSTDESPNSYICSTCHKKALVASNDVQDSLKTWIVLQYKQEKEGGTSLLDELRNGKISRNSETKESLLQEIKTLRSKLQSPSEPPSSNKSIDRLRSSSLLSQSLQLRKSGAYSRNEGDEELQKERERWTEMESEWICLTDELRVDLEANRRHAEKVEMELRLEKKCTEELDDALMRSIAGHGKMVEHYADLQEKYNELVEKHRLIMEGIAEVKRAAAKAGAKGHGKRFSKSLAAELSVLRVEREKERELLKKENRSLKIQLRDTAEAVHAAGELLENVASIQEENDKLKKQVDKQKRKHKMEMITMKQYLAESRLPESALRPLYREDSDVKAHDNDDDDQAWRAEFGAIYQDHY